MVGPAAVVIFRNVQVAQPDLTVVDSGVGVHQRRPALPEAFNLSAEQNYPGLEHLKDRIVVSGFAVAGDDLASGRSLASGLLGHRYRRTYRRSVRYDVTPAMATPSNSSSGEM